jgi:hypothetical protein
MATGPSPVRRLRAAEWGAAPMAVAQSGAVGRVSVQSLAAPGNPLAAAMPPRTVAQIPQTALQAELPGLEQGSAEARVQARAAGAESAHFQRRPAPVAQLLLVPEAAACRPKTIVRQLQLGNSRGSQSC